MKNSKILLIFFLFYTASCSVQQTQQAYWEANMSVGLKEWDRGNIEQGEKDLLRALWRARNHRGPYEVAVSLYEIGKRYIRVDRIEEGATMLEEALSIQRTIEQPDRKFTGRILAELAGSYYVLGQIKNENYIEKGKPLVQELRSLTDLFSGRDRAFINEIFASYEKGNI